MLMKILQHMGQHPPQGIPEPKMLTEPRLRNPPGLSMGGTRVDSVWGRTEEDFPGSWPGCFEDRKHVNWYLRWEQGLGESSTRVCAQTSRSRPWLAARPGTCISECLDRHSEHCAALRGLPCPLLQDLPGAFGEQDPCFAHVPPL